MAVPLCQNSSGIPRDSSHQSEKVPLGRRDDCGTILTAATLLPESVLWLCRLTPDTAPHSFGVPSSLEPYSHRGKLSESIGLYHNI
jgi:hypothetical protein